VLNVAPAEPIPQATTTAPMPGATTPR
jgi:hypothetical protein